MFIEPLNVFRKIQHQIIIILQYFIKIIIEMNLKDYKMQKGNISKKSTFWTQETT